MQLCPPHWNMLRERIDDRGLAHLISRSDAETGAIISRALAGCADSVNDYDPMIMARFLILRDVLETGAYRHGDCPLCDASDVTGMIEKASSAALIEARRLHLVPDIQ